MTRTVHKIRPFSRICVFFLIIPVVIARKSSALLIKNQMTSYFLTFLFLMTMTVHKIRDCISSARFFSSEICSAHVFFSNFCSFICSICMVLLLLKVMRLWHLSNELCAKSFHHLLHTLSLTPFSCVSMMLHCPNPGCLRSPNFRIDTSTDTQTNSGPDS